jgi:hypothetical protein
MHLGLPAEGAKGARFGPLLVVAAGAVLLLRSAPLAGGYLEKLLTLHRAGALAAVAAAVAAGFVLLAFGWWRRPGWTAAGLAAIGLAMVLLSGNGMAFLLAAIVLAATFLAGDLVVSGLRRADARAGDLSSILATGIAAAGLLVLLLAEAGALSPGWLAGACVAVIAARARRISHLTRAIRVSIRLPRGDAPRGLEAAWLAFAALVLLAAWAAVQGPDVSWDGLAYHLPEVRDIAVRHRVAVLQDLLPQAYFWKNHEAYLSLGFLLGGERVVQFLQFAAGAAVFGAGLALARRTRAGGSAALVVLGLASLPTAMLQLHATYVDWPAALLVTAAAAEIAAARVEPGRLRLGAFLLGAAVATKVFALFALPAIGLLIGRARPGRAGLAVAAACFLLPIAPWMFWSERRAGSVFEPYAGSAGQLVSRVAGGELLRMSPASGEPLPRGRNRGPAALARLPFDLVFHSSRFEANRDGYNGVLALLLLLGLAGWDGRRLLWFLAVSVPFVVPWFLMAQPSVRFLFPVYPLYAVFAAEGMARWTGRFAGAAGRAAGVTLLVVAAAFPVQFGSRGFTWRTAFGLLSREENLVAQLPAWPFWERMREADRVVFLGEYDRFHCPAALAYRTHYPPLSDWGVDPEAWRRGLGHLGIDWIVYRSDLSREASLLAALGPRLERVADHGPAVLYRVRN